MKFVTTKELFECSPGTLFRDPWNKEYKILSKVEDDVIFFNHFDIDLKIGPLLTVVQKPQKDAPYIVYEPTDIKEMIKLLFLILDDLGTDKDKEEMRQLFNIYIDTPSS